MYSILQVISHQYKWTTCEISLQKAHLCFISAFNKPIIFCFCDSINAGIDQNLWSSASLHPQQFSLLKTQVWGSRGKFQRHAESVFVSKPQLAASFSTSTADGPNTSTLLTAWEIIEGLCHDCLRYPLYFSPPDGLRSHWAVESMRSLHTLAVCLPYSTSLIKKINFLPRCLFDTWRGAERFAGSLLYGSTMYND